MAHRLIKNGALMLYGPVGELDWFSGEGFSAGDVVDALGEMEGDISLHLNSGGGSAMDGAAIYNTLKRHDGKVTVTVDALAASAASVIAMAGDEIVMGEAALLMIHNPSGITLGTADDHRQTAGVLDTMGGVFADLYSKRTGLDKKTITKMMKDETWLAADEAIAQGFATSKTEDGAAITADAGFDYQTYLHAPDHLKALAQDRRAKSLPMVAMASTAPPKPKGTDMPTPEDTAALEAQKTANANAQMAATQAAVDAAVAEVTAKQQKFTNDVMVLCTTAKMSAEDSQKIISEAKGDIVAAQAAVINFMAAKPGNGGASVPGTVSVDASEKFVKGAQLGLMHKAGLGGERNEFTGMTLMELAAQSLQLNGIRPDRSDNLKMIGKAFTMAGQHHTTDFTTVLGNVANKSMLKGYTEVDDQFTQFTSTGSLSDFKTVTRADVGLFSNLALIEEGAEYTYGTVAERSQTVRLYTYGKAFSITRQAIINDDLRAFTTIPQKMGRAAKRTVNAAVWAVLTANAAMADSIALFHASHLNLGSGALTTASFEAGRAAMARQLDADGIANINVRPAYLLVPPELWSAANILVQSEKAVLASNANTNSPNTARGAVTVIADPALTNTSVWYLVAAPGSIDTIEVSYLNGNSEPFMDERNGWSIDGVEYKVRLDFTADALDYRGMYKSTGV